MAEFIEVVKQIREMCKHITCEECSLKFDDNACRFFCRHLYSNDLQCFRQIEEDSVDWEKYAGGETE